MYNIYIYIIHNLMLDSNLYFCDFGFVLDQRSDSVVD